MTILDNLDAACAEARRRVNIGIGLRAAHTQRLIKKQAAAAQLAVYAFMVRATPHQRGRSDWQPSGYSGEEGK